MVLNKDYKKTGMTSFKNRKIIGGSQKASQQTTLKEGKFASRTKHTSKKIAINLNDEVSFTYLGKNELGCVKYIGLTAFSTRKWCGIELSRDIGKHNGTVNGKTYFVCDENFGIFIPLHKVSKVSTNKVKESSLEDSGNCTDSLEELGMRISVKSVKSPTGTLTLPASSVSVGQSVGRTTNSVSSHESLSRSSDSGIESPTRQVFERSRQPSPPQISKRTKGRASLQTKKLVISSFVAPSPKKAIVKAQRSKINDQNLNTEEEIHCKHEDFSFKHEFIRKMTEQENGNKIRNDWKQSGSSSTINIGVKSEEIFYQPPVKQPTENNDITTVVETSKINSEKCDGLSKIPRRIDHSTSISSKEKVTTDVPSLPVRKKTSLNGVLSKFRYSSTQSTSDNGKDNVVTASKAKTTKTSSRGKVDSLTKGPHNEGQAYVMGNNNAAQKSVQRRQSSTNAAEGDVEGESIRKDSTTTNRKLSENKSKHKNVIVQSNGFVDDSGIRNSQDLLRELEDLTIQLKERNNRIDELEILLKNSENIQDEEKAKSDVELNHRNTKISGLNENLLTTKGLLQHSNNGIQALSIVLQHYITQLDIISLKLFNEKKKRETIIHTNNELLQANQQSSEKLETVTTGLDSLKSQYEELQTEINNIRSSHKDEIEKLIEEHEKEKEKIKDTLQKQKDTEIAKVEDENSKCIEKLKEEHKQEIDQLIILNENQYKELLLEKQKTVIELESQHEKILQEKKSENEKILERIKSTYEEEKKQCEVELCNLKDEKHVLEDKLKTVMKQFESDTKVQVAISQYKHLPAELESLQAVVDMKNQEVKDLRVKCMELEKKRSEYYELEGKYNSLSQQNQSLNELLKKKTQIERRISVERDSLMEKFERESRKVSQLSMEKEQLIWRASNPDLRFNTLNEEVEDNPSLSERLSTSLTTAPVTKKSHKRYSMNF